MLPVYRFHVTKRLLRQGATVIGIDNLNSYYDPALKISRLHELEKLSTHSNTPFVFVKADIQTPLRLNHYSPVIFQNLAAGIAPPTMVVNLAALSVRYSLENPHAYINSNVVGFCNILEAAKIQY